MICKNISKTKTKKDSKMFQVSQFSLQQSPIQHNILEIRNVRNETENIVTELYQVIRELQNDKENLYREMSLERRKNKELQNKIFSYELENRRNEEQREKLGRKYNMQKERNQILQEDIEFVVKERIECQKKYKGIIYEMEGKIEKQLQETTYKFIDDESTLI